MAALTDPEKNILTRRANQWHKFIIPQFEKTPIALPRAG
jgi:hypothetical protein